MADSILPEGAALGTAPEPPKDIPDREKLAGRLTNWKFESAAELLKADDNTEPAMVICALAAQFGDCGHFDGQMGALIGSIVDLLLRDLQIRSEARQKPA